MPAANRLTVVVKGGLPHDIEAEAEDSIGVPPNGRTLVNCSSTASSQRSGTNELPNRPLVAKSRHGAVCEPGRGLPGLGNRRKHLDRCVDAVRIPIERRQR
jgi:hypothetical protein